MKEKIYTIPVMDGFNAGGECPFCNMYEVLDKNSIEYMLGPSYMEDDIRMDTDKKGFCKHHYEKMFELQNRLGLSLLLHTHIKKLNEDLEKAYKNMSYQGKRSFFSKGGESQLNKMSSLIDKVNSSCYICERIDGFFDNYIETFFYLWKHNPEIIDLVKNCNGFCLGHFSILLSTAESKFNSNDYKSFCDVVIPKQMQSLKALEDDIDWFTQKFDYRFKDAPWKNSKDALPRSIQKVASTKVE